MKDNFPRQRETVFITAVGDPRDVDYYLSLIKRFIEGRSYDNVERTDNKLRIYPAANND